MCLCGCDSFVGEVGIHLCVGVCVFVCVFVCVCVCVCVFGCYLSQHRYEKDLLVLGGYGG